MEFRNREELNDFLNTLKYIGEGIQWQSLLDKKTNQVYKIFSGEKLEGADYGYTYNDVMGLSHIKNDIFIWPNDVIMIDDLVAGYTHSYFEGDNFCDFNDPFGVNLDNLSYAVARANEDIKLLSRRKAEINDYYITWCLMEKELRLLIHLSFVREI